MSSQEGAMYSSVEYLLCGLPIVSTKSTGGHDVFFTDTNCIIAEDSIRVFPHVCNNGLITIQI